jgi:ketosteroid isomerase-like protein
MPENNQRTSGKEEANIRVARQSFELWEARDFNRLVPHLHEHVELIEVAVGLRHVGRDGIKEMFEKWAQAYPDGLIPVSNSFASGEQVTLEWNFAGTNTGKFEEGGTVTPPTRKAHRIPWVLRHSRGGWQGTDNQALLGSGIN